MDVFLPILVLGHKEHGKGTFSEYLTAFHNIKCMSSSVFSTENIVFPAIKDKYGYTTPEECFADRRSSDEIRGDWFTEISNFNKNGTELATALLAENDAYDGMRNDFELDACNAAKIFKTVFWVDASNRLPLESHLSMKIKFDPSYMIYVDNNGPKSVMKAFVRELNILRS